LRRVGTQDVYKTLLIKQQHNFFEIENATESCCRFGDRSMKVYEVECLAVITLAEQDMATAALRGAALVKDNPHLISVRAVHERNFEPAWEDPSSQIASAEERLGPHSKSQSLALAPHRS
jgi:hypothetical protein